MAWGKIDKMERRFIVVGLLVLSADFALAVTPVMSIAGTVNDARSGGASASSSAVKETPTVERSARSLPSSNPLWDIPLSQLSGTRDRPVFSPSRRPPPPVAVAEPVVIKPPVRKEEITPPQLLLVGTIVGEGEGFGIFVDQLGKTALRLKTGEDYQGWRLQSIQGREVTMEKDKHAAVLTLPQPGGGSGEVRLVLVSSTNAQTGRQR